MDFTVEHTRTLDFKIAFAIGLGTMIAASVFSLSGAAVATIGSSAVIGASRNRRLSQWVFGSTPDRVVDRAREAGLPVLIYAIAGGSPNGSRTICFPSIGTCAGV